MCGIVGAAGEITNAVEKAYKTMLIFDSIRGVDSTGTAAISRHADTIIAKQVGNPFELMDHSTFTKAMARVNRVLIGHNRFATQGGVNRMNAHPFDFDTLVGVHNGTLTNKWKLDDSADFKVDSQNLYHHINKNGLKHAMNIAEGAWSLVWWDKVEETLNFLRNKERPMYIAETENSNTILWASESWMIEVACMREGIKIKEIEATEIDHHYEFEIPKMVIQGEYICKPKVNVIKAQPKPLDNNHFGGYPIRQNQSSVQVQVHQPEVVSKSGAKENESVTPTGKVVSFTKAPTKTEQKNTVTPTKLGGEAYSGSKRVTLDVLSECVDRHGARYVVCFDEKMPSTSVRLYLNKKDKAEKLVNEQIYGDIGKYHLEIGGKGYFKVDYSTFRLVNPKRDEHEIKTYLSKNGQFLSKDDWEQKHGECCWCSGPISAGDDHEFAAYGDDETVCGVCMKSDEVQQYVR